MKKISVVYSSIIHREKYAVYYMQGLKTAYWMWHAYKTPKDLTILTLHNYTEKSLFERSLDFLGIDDYVVLSEQFEGPWRHTLKIQWIVNYLRAGRCKTKYLLYCDARDSILRVDPQIVLDLFLERNVSLLFNATMSKKAYYFGMPSMLEWARTVAPRLGRYLNSGAFIGKTDFVQKVYERAMDYVDPNQYIVAGDVKRLNQFLEFPKGMDDQTIFRYLQREFHPAMSIDYYNRIFYRN